MDEDKLIRIYTLASPIHAFDFPQSKDTIHSVCWLHAYLGEISDKTWKLMLESHYRQMTSEGVMKKQKGKYVNPLDRLESTESYTAEFQEAMDKGRVPYIPLAITLLEVELQECTHEPTYDAKIKEITEAWINFLQKVRALDKGQNH